MSAVDKKRRAFIDALEARMTRVLHRLAPEEQETRRELLRLFQSKGLPHHKDEEWKYTSLRLLSEASFSEDSPTHADASELKRIPGLTDGIRLVFWNGRFAPELSEGQLPDGVEFANLSIPLKGQGKFGRIARLDGKLGSTNDERFVWLNAALYEDGACLTVAPGQIIEEPIQVVFLNGGDVPILVFPRLFIRVGANSQAKVVEFHSGSGVYASVGLAEVVVDESAVLEHTRLQDESREAFHIATLAIEQAGGSTYTSNMAQFGGRIGRSDVNVWIGGERCETWLNGAYVGTGEQHLDNHTRIDHALPNCHSFEVYKGILADRANGVFNGKIFVYPDAQKTDAKQTNQALLLSPTATVDTKPQLEIFADDVKCTHGATVGQLREDAMFYLRSRGIPREEARNLLVYAFVAEVLERISIDHVREAFEKRLFEKLGERRA